MDSTTSERLKEESRGGSARGDHGRIHKKEGICKGLKNEGVKLRTRPHTGSQCRQDGVG